jgi:predicted CxxxxCH...CXXCH cytochrome family protein
VLHAAPTRSTLRAAAVLAAVVLAACGTSRETAGGDYLCGRCHGDAARPALVEPSTLSDAEKALIKSAPPRAISGATATTELGVGAHQAHLVGGRLRGPIPCGECHVVPADMQAHEAGIAAIAAGTAQRVTFGTLADQGAAVAAWNRASAKCSNTYCHGATLDKGGTNHAPTWTNVDPDTHPEVAGCGPCHGFGPTMPAPHTTATNCVSCHPDTVDATWKILVTGGVSTHMNGRLDVAGLICSGTCTSCHGAPTGGSAPLSGAHLAHVTSTATTYGVDSKTSDTLSPTTANYDFGCGNCHSTNCDDHAKGSVVLSPLNATAGSLKARNAVTAAYNAVDGTCAGVYCHSSGQSTPVPVASPGWFSGATLGCGDCHANPPSYSNGGAGAATANSHIGLLLEGDGLTYEVGHFGGFPSMMHDWSRHGRGANDSAPITCQACHYDTADATNVGPSGFYYLDTSGDYDLGGTGNCFGGSGPTCSGGMFITAYACTGCHTGTPPAQGGRARPYYHVNGTRDVSFDRRTTVTGTPTPLNVALTPTRPYWLTAPGSFSAIDTTGHIDGTAIVAGTTWSTLSVDLATASWNATTKTCSSVDCHFFRTTVQWGEPLSSSPTTGNCIICHNF